MGKSPVLRSHDHRQTAILSNLEGLNRRDCADSDFEQMNKKVYEKITYYAKDLKATAEKVEREFGIPIINKRISITPIAEILGHASVEQAVELAKTLDKAAIALGVDFIGGYSALIHKGISVGEQTLLDALPEALSLLSFGGLGSIFSDRGNIGIHDRHFAKLLIVDMDFESFAMAAR